MTAANLSPLETLRRARHGRWLEELRRDVAATLEESAPAAGVMVFLFGSRARGDWDGFSDTDLLVVGTTREQAEEVADRLLGAGVGDDVLAISQDHWQRMASSPSAEKRAIPAEALLLWGQAP